MDFTEDSEFCQILGEWKPHLPKTEATIQIIVEELKRGSDINWGNFRILIGELYEHHYRDLDAYQIPNAYPNRTKFEKFILNVLAVFETHKCSDMSVIVDVLEFLCLFSAGAVNDKAVQMGEGQREDDFFEKFLFFSYEDIPSLFSPLFDHMPTRRIFQHVDWVRRFTVRGEVDALKAIITFGATPIVHKDAQHEHRNIYVTMALLLELDRVVKAVEESSYVSRFLQNLKTEFNERSRRRLFFINTILQIFILHTRGLPDKFVQCARIFVKSSPEPLITSEEIKNFMTKLCNGFNLDEKVQQFLEKYESSFPESREDIAPRSLRHLSRFQVRDSLRTARSFPHGVKSLCVPKKIQNYICFKDILL